MDGSKEGPDASSIKPVSSLRSRFENLEKDKSTPPASPAVGGRSPWLAPGGPAAVSRPSTPSGKGDVPDFAPLTSSQVPAPAAPRARRPTPPRSRPQSMISMTPKQPSPPAVTVDSPASPERRSMDVRPMGLNPQGAQTPRSGVDSPTRGHAKTLSRAATPGLESRMNALFQVGEVSKPSIAPTSNGAAASTSNSKPANGAPPPVNRAGKPKVPSKPTVLAQKPSNLAAPEPPGDVSDRSASPFNTPPGSGTSSPGPGRTRNDSDVSFVQRLRGDSDASFAQRLRGDSDASFVERVRTNSDASAKHRVRGESNASFAERARAGSNASFVEPSSLPEHHHHFGTPPAQHQIASRQGARSGTMPARYRPVAVSERSAAGDLPDDRPRLPSRPELQMRPGRASPPKARSGRTSPLKRELDPRAPIEGIRRAQTLEQPAQKIPASKPVQRSALAQGFDRAAPPPPTAASVQIAPAIPAPRRSTDRRRDPPPPPPPATNGAGHSREDDREDALPLDGAGMQPMSASDFPDSSQASRRPPRHRKRPWEISTDYDTRTFAVCGEYVCTTGHQTKVWNLKTGQQLLDMLHNEITKVTALVFKPSPTAEDEGKRIWLGTSIGEIHEVDVPSQSIVKTKANAHPRKGIVKMFRYASELWTLDDGGEINVWKPDQKGMCSLDSQYTNFRTVKGHTFSIAVGKHLWLAAGKDIRVYAPSARSDADFQMLWNALSQPNTGDIHSGATMSGKPDLVHFGHQDGKVSIYNRHDFSCVGVVSVSVYKLSSLAGVGDYLWAGFNTGMAYVYDTSKTPWKVMKDWKAHEKQILGINADRSAVWKLDRLQVVTLGTDNMLRIWDGMLEEDWLDGRMQEHDSEYCTFRELSAAVLSWNAGASKPYYLEKTKEDNNFFREYLLDPRGAPDIFIFGFQELVDLEDKKMTAKSFFKSKKKDTNELEHMSHQYRAWRDHLTRCVEEFMPASSPYVLLHTASLVGLFTCVFVKADLRARIKHVHAAEVKRGMGGYHGNKGALIVRMVVDDSSVCLVNCHLAAGQTQTIHRNNDVAAILESDTLPEYPLDSATAGAAQHADVFTSGGDGSMVLDHEIAILHGDLNYRIDTMGRDTVVKHVRSRDLGRLLERDQLLLSRKKNPGFRLRAFSESPITFAPTYKYNLGSDEYDSSEKRRSPAWCDRILYRGLGKVKMEEYRRWEVRVSDHRPVSGRLRLRVKKVDAGRRAQVSEAVAKEFEAVRGRVWRGVQLEYLTNVLGLSPGEAKKALEG